MANQEVVREETGWQLWRLGQDPRKIGQQGRLEDLELSWQDFLVKVL